MPCQGRKKQGDRIERAVLYHLRQKPHTALGLMHACGIFAFSQTGVQHALNRLMARGVASRERQIGWPAFVYSLGVAKRDAAA